MSEQGAIHVADLNGEIRQRVVVVSNSRFNRRSGRAIVIPELLGGAADAPYPWRIAIGDAVFAVDFVRAVPSSAVRERIGAVPYADMQQLRRVLALML